MKRFICKVSIGALLICIFACGLDYIISKGLLQMEDYRFMSWSEMWSGEINADVLIMGNSRGFSHFEPWTIDSICGTNTYCIGLGGYSITVELLKYHFYRYHNKKPKYIIQQVDYYTMRNDSAPHRHQSEQFLPLFYDLDIREDLKKVGYTWLDLYIPLYRYFGYQMVIKNGLLEYLGIKHYISDPSCKGHHYEKGKWNGEELAKMDTIIATMDATAQSKFEQFLEICQKENIKVVLVNSPTYLGANLKTKNLDLVNQYFDSIANAYCSIYLNYNENYSLCEDSTNFCVSVHMNPEATHKFSIDFANDLLKNIQ